MVFLTPVNTGEIDIERGLFLSTEMSRQLAKEINNGNLQLSAGLVPVHLPWDGLFKNYYGENDNLRVGETKWLKAGLPYIYDGSELHDKKLVVFPMHGLGDQLYLAVALRAIAGLYPTLKVFIVRPSIQSSEQWYNYIYHDNFFCITGPVVTTHEMTAYDYYVDAEHFAHMKAYEGVYPPEFYMERLFFHTINHITNMRPVICSCLLDPAKKKCMDEFMQKLRHGDKPVVFLSTTTTGRVRDIPVHTVLSFIDAAKKDYSFIVSAYNNKNLENEIHKLSLPNVVLPDEHIKTIDGLIYLLSVVDYVITSDSGITHLAEALETPCGSVFNVVTPVERTKPYEFSEEMMVEFEIPGVCKTPCYVHALEESQECPGMKWQNEIEHTAVRRIYAPCMLNLTGEHLMMLLDSLSTKFRKEVQQSEFSEIDSIIENNVFRKDVYNVVPEGSAKILDFGCNQGELLFRLRRDKHCTDLYGIEINEDSKVLFDKYLDGSWIIDLGDKDAELDDNYLNYFNFIILHDVVEHLYDPWYVVEKLRKYLAPEGKIVVVVPNIQYWGILEQIVNGSFPYGAGGLMNEDHIRWFTCSSIIELALIAGYEIDYFLPLFPPGTDLSGYNERRIHKALRFPPAENGENGKCEVQITFDMDLKKNYYLFLANKILLVCRNSPKPVCLKRLTVGGLQERKKALNINFKCNMD
ncbi:MAG: methyltransferase domain-containing protein [Proteobacteria bacterium]|nr:methyltransferase domain-containing protein [Pseudomonadota bacterium]